MVDVGIFFLVTLIPAKASPGNNILLCYCHAVAFILYSGHEENNFKLSLAIFTQK